ncbi:MAG: PAS domain-containing protein [Desulfobacterales bacterium]|nr:PAS domain-containing protein [Desulfobacterales bacterium]
METRTTPYRFWSRIPPWIFIGAMAVLLPILALITVTNINRQKENSQRLLLEKGAALIRSFEAGTRFGMMGMMGGHFQLQRLLVETASQPDIVYLLVTGLDSVVEAHSDPEQIGTVFSRGLNSADTIEDGNLHWRQIIDPQGKPVFEVYRLFRAAPRHMGMGGEPGRGMGRMRHDHLSYRPAEKGDRPRPERIIFVGLDMTPAETARQADMRHSVFMAVILLLVGLAGIVLLFMTQEYRATRQRLSHIRAFSDQLVDAMPMGLVSVDRNGRLAAVNPAARQVLGLNRNALVGAAADTALPSELVQAIESPETANPRTEKEIDCCMNAGRTVPLGLSASVWHDEDGAGLGHILLIRDLTEVHALRREIARSQRLASIGSLAAGVAHEIRNPLSSIKGFATYFQERYKDVDADRDTAAIMIQEVDRLNRVVGQLLELSRPVDIARQPIQIDVLVARSLALIEARAKEDGIRIERDIPVPSPEIRLDADRMQQVLLNLFLNAMDAMEIGGTLKVSVGIDRDRHLEIRVADTGHGIAPDRQQQIFDPYFTTKPTGTGLGLAIVHNIMEAHQGQIAVESRPGGGTVTTLRLPMDIEETV